MGEAPRLTRSAVSPDLCPLLSHPICLTSIMCVQFLQVDFRLVFCLKRCKMEWPCRGFWVGGPMGHINQHKHKDSLVWRGDKEAENYE